MCIFQLNIGNNTNTIFTAKGFHIGNLLSAYLRAYAAIKKPLSPHVGAPIEHHGSNAANDEDTYATAHVPHRGLN